MNRVIQKVIPGGLNAGGTQIVYQLDQRSLTRDRKKSNPLIQGESLWHVFGTF